MLRLARFTPPVVGVVTLVTLSYRSLWLRVIVGSSRSR